MCTITVNIISYLFVSNMIFSFSLKKIAYLICLMCLKVNIVRRIYVHCISIVYYTKLVRIPYNTVSVDENGKFQIPKHTTCR